VNQPVPHFGTPGTLFCKRLQDLIVFPWQKQQKNQAIVIISVKAKNVHRSQQ
jgi:hypothetical protein